MTSLLVKNLCPKTSIDILQGCFYPYKPFKVLELLEDGKESKTARIEFEKTENALKAIDEMNMKEILGQKVQIELFDKVQLEQKDDSKKETIAEAVYPIALERYGQIAPKLTGMLVESILKNTRDDNDLLNDLLGDDIILDELVDYAYEKYVLEH